MDTTPISLLQRVRQPDDTDAWRRLVELTTPLLFAWAYRAGLRDHDAADLVQDVLAVLVDKLPTFDYDRERSFRGWLRTVTKHKLLERRRKRLPDAMSPDDPRLGELPDPTVLDPFWEQEYRQKLVGLALELMRAHFQPTTWQACWEHVVSGRSAADVAAELGLTPAAVYVAKGRVLRRLRAELNGMWE
ncbi:MAG TPA: sigma-70 family RNA polymerase sigma factor [Pirellulales bacterium]|nr:sigma-70 family RNA polymerase sigma factor [Pirellulales bacterium]